MLCDLQPCCPCCFPPKAWTYGLKTVANQFSLASADVSAGTDVPAKLPQSNITAMQAVAYGATMFGSAAINNIWSDLTSLT